MEITDELLLAIYCPRGVHIYRHDGQLGVSRTGRWNTVNGLQIKLHGPCGEHDWRASLDERILPKLLDAPGCDELGFVDWAN